MSIRNRAIALLFAMAIVSPAAADGVINGGGPAYTLPTATPSALGGVKPDGTTIGNAAGIISTTYGSSANTAAQGNDSRITGAAQATVVAGSWTPADGSGAALTFSTHIGTYNRIGNLIQAQFIVVYPVTADASAAIVSGLPVTYPTGYSTVSCSVKPTTNFAGAGIGQNSTLVSLYTAAGVSATNAQLSSATIIVNCIYPAT